MLYLIRSLDKLFRTKLGNVRYNLKLLVFKRSERATLVLLGPEVDTLSPTLLDRLRLIAVPQVNITVFAPLNHDIGLTVEAWVYLQLLVEMRF